MLRRLLVFAIILCMLGGIAPAYTAGAAQPAAKVDPKVQEAVKLGIVPKSIQGNYQKLITREEFVSMFVNAVFTWQKNKIYRDAFFPDGTQPITREEFLQSVKVTDYSFKDVKNEDVKLAYMMGFIKEGTSKTAFSPGKPVTRQDAAVMLVNYYQMNISITYREFIPRITDLNKADPKAKDPLAAAYEYGLMEGSRDIKGDSTSKMTINPLGKLTREQAILVYLNIYKNHDMYVSIRGVLDYTREATKIEWEISRNTVRAVKFKEDMSINENDWLYLCWNHYKPTNKYPDASREEMFAGANTGEHIDRSLFTDEMNITAAKGINAVFDLGWAEYEMLGEGFICEYRLKDNGIHGYKYYGGSKRLKVPFKRIR